MPLKWNGDKVAAKVVAASKRGVDKTMSECVRTAKREHEFTNQTGTLEGSVRIVDHAGLDGGQLVGRWGSADVNYAIYVETGTSRMAARPFLRPAADKHYPALRASISDSFLLRGGLSGGEVERGLGLIDGL